MKNSLGGAVVVITGGASGIGKLMAQHAAAQGASHIFIWDLDEEAAILAAQDLELRGTTATGIEVDVSNNASVKRAAEATWEHTDHVDVLINNAGIVTGKNFLDLTEADIHRTYQVNTLALYRVTRQFLPSMIERGTGSITTIASAAGLIGVSRQTDYSGSKFGAIGFTEALRAELRRNRIPIHTLIVQPFYINTGMFDGVSTKVPWLLPILEPDDVARKVITAIVKGRQSLVLPKTAALVKLTKILPVPLHDKLADVLGVNNTMDDFVGHSKVDFSKLKVR